MVGVLGIVGLCVCVCVYTCRVFFFFVFRGYCFFVVFGARRTIWTSWMDAVVVEWKNGFVVSIVSCVLHS